MPSNCPVMNVAKHNLEYTNGLLMCIPIYRDYNVRTCDKGPSVIHLAKSLISS